MSVQERRQSINVEALEQDVAAALHIQEVEQKLSEQENSLAK